MECSPIGRKLIDNLYKRNKITKCRICDVINIPYTHTNNKNPKFHLYENIQKVHFLFKTTIPFSKKIIVKLVKK